MNPLFTPTTLDDLRAISEASMKESCTILREPRTEESDVVVTDELGDPVYSTQEEVDNAPGDEIRTKCRIAGGPKTETERLVAGRLQTQSAVMVVFPLGTDVREGDTVVVRGLNLEILWVPDPVPTESIDLRVMAERES